MKIRAPHCIYFVLAEVIAEIVNVDLKKTKKKDEELVGPFFFFFFKIRIFVCMYCLVLH